MNFDLIVPDDWEDTFKTIPGEVVLPCFVRTGELTGVPGKSTVTQAGTVHVLLRMDRAGDWRNMLLGPETLSQPSLRQLLQRFSKPSSEGGPPHDP